MNKLSNYISCDFESKLNEDYLTEKIGKIILILFLHYFQ